MKLCSGCSNGEHPTGSHSLPSSLNIPMFTYYILISCNCKIIDKWIGSEELYIDAYEGSEEIYLDAYETNNFSVWPE